MRANAVTTPARRRLRLIEVKHRSASIATLARPNVCRTAHAVPIDRSGVPLRQNLPVTGRELSLAPSATLVSRTDLKGRITYANRAFVEASGFSEAELLGQPHNLVRHPDMPSEAFADLWATLKAGRPWVGMVKNRCKDGDHYWVEAHVTPLREDGAVVGYMSVRRPVSAARIAAAEAGYAALRAGASTLTVRRGALVRVQRWRRLNPLWLLSLRQRLVLAALGSGAAAAACVLLAMQGRGLLAWAAVAAGTGLAVYCARWLSHDVVDRLEDASAQFEALIQGRYDAPVAIDRDDEVGRLLLELKAMQVQLGFRIDEDRRRADEACRVRAALDVAQANVLVADHDLQVVYANGAMDALIETAGADLRRDLPALPVGGLVGSSLHVMAPAGLDMPALAGLNAAHACELRAGGRTLRMLFTPVFDDSGARIGLVGEWQDRTVELALEREVAGIVGAAARGDFAARIALGDKHGFLRQLSEDINRLLDATGTALAELDTVVTAMAAGDLTPRIGRELHGLFGRMKQGMNTTLDRLAGVVATIRAGAESVDATAREIAAGNADLACRTERQVAALEETGSAMDGLTRAVEDNARDAARASDVATAARHAADAGGAAMGDVVLTMQVIETASQRMGEIVEVIDAIAFQTNLLALNAAVEAARAGEQGRGFGVVAGEVRALAQRSAHSARDIRQLIDESTRSVQAGSAQVSRAGEAIGAVVARVAEVDGLIAAISATASGQGRGIAEVNAAVRDMDAGAQQNAALVEQAAAATLELERQARELLGRVDVFQLAGDATTAPALARAA